VPDYKPREVRQCLAGKLAAQETESRRHIFFNFYDSNGQFLVQTHISHGDAPIHIGLISQMAKQMGVRTADFRGVIECSVSRDDFMQRIARRPS